MAAALSIFALLNLHCWRPGTGGRRDLVDGKHPRGSELELYYGWPSCYRAELFRSDDPTLMMRAGPFYFSLNDDGWVASRYVGWLAIGLDLSFALIATVLVALCSEVINCERRLTGVSIFIALVLVLILVAEYYLSGSLDVYL